MAVLQMQHISICALKKDRKQILELIQRLGMIEITDEISEDDLFQKMDLSKSRNGFEKNVSLAKEALEILNLKVKESSPFMNGFSGRRVALPKDYYNFSDRYESTIKKVKEILSATRRIQETKAEILKLEEQMELLLPWENLDIPIHMEGTKSTAAWIGILPNEWKEESIYEKLVGVAPIYIHIISTSPEQTCIFALCMKDKMDETYEILRENGFSKPGTFGAEAPIRQKSIIQKQIEEAKRTILQEEEHIMHLAEFRNDIRFLADYDTMRMDKYEVISHLLQTKNVFFLTGYIPVRDQEKIEDELNTRFDVSISYRHVGDEEDVPVLLQNNAFSAPVEGVIEAYSPPGKGETDPTTAVSIFYYMLFGIMFSDAGYGALMSVVCAILLKKHKEMEDGMKRMLQMFFFCGLATIFWGLIFGSIFGDSITVIASTFFHSDFSIPALWFNPTNEPMRMLTFSMVIGIIHLFTGLGMKGFQYIKQRDWKGILYDVASWYLLLIGSILVLMSMKMFVDILGISFVLSKDIGTAGTIMAVVGSVIILATNGRDSRNPFKRFLKGAYALYGITGYLSDVLSYSRLLALGLATGVIGSVINKMGAMAGDSPIGMILFLIVFLLGHVLNIAINALGAYVHTNRLQYVEFFGKFYEGGGRKFSPFKVNTKYYKFKERIENE